VCHEPRRCRHTRGPSTPADITAALAQAPACRRIVFETGRMAPMLLIDILGDSGTIEEIDENVLLEAMPEFRSVSAAGMNTGRPAAETEKSLRSSTERVSL
jgi:hypothetical protein